MGGVQQGSSLDPVVAAALAGQWISVNMQTSANQQLTQFRLLTFLKACHRARFNRRLRPMGWALKTVCAHGK